MIKHYITLSFAVLVFSFVSCDKTMEFIEQPAELLKQPEHKTITISDSADDNYPNWGVELELIKGLYNWYFSPKSYPPQIKDINNKIVLVSLLRDDLLTLIMDGGLQKSDFLNSKSIYTIGRVTNNKINLKLYTNGVDYWTGTGKYYILFLISENDASKLSDVYYSPMPHDFSTANTHLNNIDFLGPWPFSIDITDTLPF
jgi:hypothetical protein